MKVGLENIFVVLTPFQLKMMKEVYEEKLKSSGTVIFHTRHVPIESENFQSTCIEIQFETFSFIELQRSPLKSIKAYREQIKVIKNYVNRFIERVDLGNKLQIVIGTDKDIFTQVLLNKLYTFNRKQLKLHAVEEGLGYYIKEDSKDKFKAFIYRLLTPVLFGERIIYHRQLGTDHRINKLFVRLPNMLPAHKNLIGKEISELKLHESIPSSPKTTNKVLIFSFPNEDYAISSDDKKVIYEKLLTNLKGRDIVIKPHPRESTEVFKSFPEIDILEKSKVGEDLDYFQFEMILNFSSSVIIDILSRGYPVDRIFTIAITPIRFAFFEKTNCLGLADIKDYKFEIKT